MDLFTIFTTGGIVLWQKKFQPVSPSIIDSLVADIFIEGRKRSGEESSFTKDLYTVKWTTANDLGLIFVAVYQSLLRITFIDDLLYSVKKLFTTLYENELKKRDPSYLPVCKFDDYFNFRYAELEKQTTINGAMNNQSKANGIVSEDVKDDEDVQNVTSQDIDDNTATLKLKQTLAVRRGGKRVGRGSTSVKASTGSTINTTTKKTGKKQRKWDADGVARDSDEEDGPLDFSAVDSEGSKEGPIVMDDPQAIINWGAKTNSGEFLLNDLSSEINSILANSDGLNNKDISSSSLSGFGFFRNIIGSRVLSEGDLENALAGMKDHLMKKNVAPEVAQHLCNVVSRSLIGTKTGSWTSIEKTVRSSMEDALRKILTPSTSVDLLHEIQRVKQGKPSRPYVISVVGVNGVGKSTNLSKIAFWLLQNNMKLLIAACDTFRSGAVEQLRVHARNLKQLSAREGGEIELFEKGYGKDAALIARDAIKYGGEHGFDVVLIDTAGRRHNDTRLMSNLEKFAKYANPDKIIMVGEALVGTDSVQQARNFNAAFGNSRNLDFFLISKCDTVGDMIGSMVNMTYSTGIPVLFVGTGQTYTDLRTLSVPWAVNMLMC
ncbi:SRP54-type protein [Dipodascopsis uninucleata]